mgnify:CR=1 FL=1
MDCRRAKGLILSEYSDGLLRGHALEELKSHMGACPSCHRLAESVKSTGDLLRSSIKADAPQVVWDRIVADISGLSLKRNLAETVSDRFKYVFYRLRPAVVAAAAVVILVFALATVSIISNINYSTDLAAREDIINMISLNGDGGSDTYSMGTSVETYFL